MRHGVFSGFSSPRYNGEIILNKENRSLRVCFSIAPVAPLAALLASTALLFAACSAPDREGTPPRTTASVIPETTAAAPEATVPETTAPEATVPGTTVPDTTAAPLATTSPSPSPAPPPPATAPPAPPITLPTVGGEPRYRGGKIVGIYYRELDLTVPSGGGAAMEGEIPQGNASWDLCGLTEGEWDLFQRVMTVQPRERIVIYQAGVAALPATVGAWGEASAAAVREFADYACSAMLPGET